jgi:tetratricopeptide (TPR) repeat protein
MSNVKEDPIKFHKDANALMESDKPVEARDLFIKSGELYFKSQNYFGAAEMYYKAGECSANLKEYPQAVEFFNKAADIALGKGFDRYGLSALEEARNAQKVAGNIKEAEEIDSKIKEINDKINKQNAVADDDSSFSIFS